MCQMSTEPSESNQLYWQPAPSELAWLTCNAGMAPQGRWAYALPDSISDQPSQLYLFDVNMREKTLLSERPSTNSAGFDMDWSPSGNYLIWISPDPQFPVQNFPDYDLWTLRVGQKQPYILAKQVAFGSKRLWLK